MPAVILALVMALTTVGGGAVYASQDALPGDALYGVKTGVEELQLKLASSDEARAQIRLELTVKRLDEIEKASSSGKVAAADKATEALGENLTQIDRLLGEAEESGKDVSAIVTQLIEKLSRHQQALEAVQERVPERARASLAKAAEKAEKGLMRAVDRILEKAAVERQERPGPSPTPTSAAGGVTQATAKPTVTATVGISTTVSVTLTQTISNVQDLASDPAARGQSYNGLLAKLKSASAALERGRADVAGHVLDAFLRELNAFERAGHISAENYNSLYDSYTTLVRSLGGSPLPSEPAVARPESGSGPARAKPEPAEAKPEPGEREDRNAEKEQKDNRPAPKADDADIEQRRRPAEAPTKPAAPTDSTSGLRKDSPGKGNR